jgi:hypothetical protein
MPDKKMRGFTGFLPVHKAMVSDPEGETGVTTPCWFIRSYFGQEARQA